MNWFYDVGGRPQGPVSEPEFQAMVKAGTIGPESQVWREGLAAWVPLRTLQAKGGVMPVPGQLQCSQCRLWFASEDVIHYEGQAICGACKPVFFQKLLEGVAVVDIGLWQNQHYLVADPLRAEFPDRCVRCNRPAEGFRYSVRLTAYVTLSFRHGFQSEKYPALSVGLCRWHRLVRGVLFKLSAFFGVALVGLAVLAKFADAKHTAAYMGGAVVCAISGVILLAATQFLTQASGFQGGTSHVLLTGAGKKFLAALPEWRNHR